jgi:hypothetical protein
MHQETNIRQHNRQQLHGTQYSLFQAVTVTKNTKNFLNFSNRWTKNAQ